MEYTAKRNTMGWLETRGALLRQLREVLERDGWEAMITSYEYKKYSKAERQVSCKIAPYHDKGRPTMTGYWVTFILPLTRHPRPGERNKIRRFRTPIDEGINETIVLSKIESLFRTTETERR